MPLPDTEIGDMDDQIEQWRRQIEPGLPGSFRDIPLDLPVIALETPYQATARKQQNFFEFPDFDDFQDFSGVHNIQSQAGTSQSRSTSATADTWSANVYLKPLPERSSSIALADCLEQASPLEPQAEDALSDVSREQVEESRTVCQTGDVSSLDLGGTTLRETPISDVIISGDGQDDISTQRPSLRLTIPVLEVKEVKLLNGNPFSLSSLDSTSTRTSIRAPGDGDLKATVPRHVQSKKPRVSTSETSVTASIAHTHMTDIAIPIFPYAHLTTVCRGRQCSIIARHEKGPYLHEGKLRTREGSIFGASNPPPNVWDAFDRLRYGFSKDPEDVKLVDNFKKFHFGFAQQDNPEFLRSPVKSQAGSTNILPVLPTNGGFWGNLKRWGAFRRR